MYIGAHLDPLPNTDNILDVVKKIYMAGGNAIQIFMSSSPDLSIDRIRELKQYINTHNFIIVIHSSYTHNLARKWDNYSSWIQAIQIEIKYAYAIGATAIVIHFGKSLDMTIQEAYNNMYSALIYIHTQTVQYSKVKILLETPAGQGTELCANIDDLTYFYNKIRLSNNREFADRIKLCVDTCHIFAAGHDISSIINTTIYLNDFDEHIDLNNIGLIHLNDSLLKFASHKDRHANIASGYIGLENLKYICNFFSKLNIPIILETPNYGFISEIKMLKKIEK